MIKALDNLKLKTCLISGNGRQITNKVISGSGVRKRKRGDENPNAVLSGDYSLEVLMNTEFPQNMGLGELAERIASALGERDAKFLKR